MVTRARMFTAKPDGDVNIFMLQVRRSPAAGLCLSARECLLHEHLRVCTGFVMMACCGDAPISHSRARWADTCKNLDTPTLALGLLAATLLWA